MEGSTIGENSALIELCLYHIPSMKSKFAEGSVQTSTPPSDLDTYVIKEVTVMMIKNGSWVHHVFRIDRRHYTPSDATDLALRSSFEYHRLPLNPGCCQYEELSGILEGYKNVAYLFTKGNLKCRLLEKLMGRPILNLDLFLPHWSYKNLPMEQNIVCELHAEKTPLRFHKTCTLAKCQAVYEQILLNPALIDLFNVRTRLESFQSRNFQYETDIIALANLHFVATEGKSLAQCVFCLQKINLKSCFEHSNDCVPKMNESRVGNDVFCTHYNGSMYSQQCSAKQRFENRKNFCPSYSIKTSVWTDLSNVYAQLDLN